MVTATLPIQITTPEEAVRVAQEIERLEGVLKALKDVLKKHIEQTGIPVETDDQIWNIWVTERWEFADPEKKKRLAEAVAIEGVNPWEIFGIGADGIKLLRKMGWDDAALMSFGEKKLSHRFDSKKKK